MGRSAEEEVQVLQMFVSSLRETEFVKACGKAGTAFTQVFDLEQRPLLVVVAWGDPRISEQDATVVRELSLHLAGAFVQQSDPQFTGK